MASETQSEAPVRRVGRPRIHFEEKRDQIIQAATELFAQRGFHGTSIGQICERAGVGRGVLYHYIPSKEFLLFAIHERSAEPFLERARNVVAAGGPPDAILQGLSREIMRSVASYLSEMTVFFHEWRTLQQTNRARWQEVRSKRREFESMVQDAIEEGQRQGIFKEFDPRLATLAFLGMHNFAYQWLDPKGRLSPEEIADNFFRIFLEGIKQPSQT